MCKNYQNKSVLQKLTFSPFIINKTPAKKIAYIAVVTAFLTVCNTLLEFSLFDAQYSLTIATSAIAGILIGPLSGFASCMFADAIGFLMNSKGGIYMLWVGLAIAVTSFLAGVIFHFIRFKFKGAVFVKLALICIASFTVGTVLINTTGFYMYNYYVVGLPIAFLEYVSTTLGTSANYLTYLIYRLFFKGLIFNCLVNYGLIFVLTPMIISTPIFKKDLQ
ncbi:MAG: hypothetical protein J6R88_05670 [Clostridia bacterium]|nr:hypothetical protein [Clostridia bacterium]